MISLFLLVILVSAAVHSEEPHVDYFPDPEVRSIDYFIRNKDVIDKDLCSDVTWDAYPELFEDERLKIFNEQNAKKVVACLSDEECSDGLGQTVRMREFVEDIVSLRGIKVGRMCGMIPLNIVYGTMVRQMLENKIEFD